MRRYNCRSNDPPAVGIEYDSEMEAFKHQHDAVILHWPMMRSSSAALAWCVDALPLPVNASLPHLDCWVRQLEMQCWDGSGAHGQPERQALTAVSREAPGA